MSAQSFSLQNLLARIGVLLELRCRFKRLVNLLAADEPRGFRLAYRGGRKDSAQAVPKLGTRNVVHVERPSNQSGPHSEIAGLPWRNNAALFFKIKDLGQQLLSVEQPEAEFGPEGLP